MRISCKADDPGYDPEAIVKEYEIRCDGKLIEYVVTVDDVEGFVTFIPRGEDGEALVNEERTDLKNETVYGKVEIQEI